MLILWILLLIALIVLLNDLYLMIKRLTLLRKIKKQVKKHNGRMQYRRNPLISIFKRDGKVDISAVANENNRCLCYHNAISPGAVSF